MSICLTACGIYSLSGINLSPDVKTISVANISLETGAPPYAAQLVTDRLRTYFLQNTNLRLVNSGGDIQISGSMVGYDVSSIAPTANNQSAQNRLTIRLKLDYTNTKDEKQSFKDQQFSDFCDFENTKTLNQVENTMINCILDKIELNVFNKTVATW